MHNGEIKYYARVKNIHISNFGFEYSNTIKCFDSLYGTTTLWPMLQAFFTAVIITVREKARVTDTPSLITQDQVEAKQDVKNNDYKKTIVVQNKSNLLLKIFLQTFEHYNY